LESNKCLPLYKNGHPKFVDAASRLYELCEEIDPYNNQHRLHPEEILAYYWSLLVFPKTGLDNLKRSFLIKIRECLHNGNNNIF
jgi:hypothetical protein